MTVIYVGLDFPPEERYVAGWRQIDSYLREKEKQNGFKSLIVRRRDHNCGVYGETSNDQLLIKEISEFSKGYIFSEDDNEFSPNFLVFMNQALDKYADDPKVIAVSGYTSPVFSNLVEETTFFSLDFSAYGAGFWLHKKPATQDLDLGRYMRDLSFRRMWSLFWSFPTVVSMTVDMVRQNVYWGDIVYTMNNLLFGTLTLQPTQSLSRNWGLDGSGLRTGIVVGAEKETIQDSPFFVLNDILFVCPKVIRRRCIMRNMPRNFFRFVNRFIKIFYKVFKYWALG